MTDKEFRALQRFLKGCLKFWIAKLRLFNWSIHIDYSREGLTSANVDGQMTCLGTTSAMWQYQDALITFNMPALHRVWEEGENNAVVENVVVHELMHILLHQMREGVIQCEEIVATNLARAFCGLATFAE